MMIRVIMNKQMVGYTSLKEGKCGLFWYEKMPYAHSSIEALMCPIGI